MSSNDRLRVLVVDDERANITLLVDALKSDYRTVVAKNGPQALERARSESPPDIVLLDIMMPEMDGYEVCRQLKADERTKHIPVIFVSTMSEVGDETRGLDIGAVDYITKPFNPAIVRARVRTHLDSANARAKVSALLDNSGQGFLSFGKDLLVDGEYSRECRKIFGAPIAGVPVNDLLYPEDGTGRTNFAKNIGRILSETDEFKRDLYISLMPGEFSVNGSYLRAEYRLIGEEKLMLILTDITSQKELEQEVRQERTRLKFIVSAVRDTIAFLEILKDFDEFDDRKLEDLLGSGAPAVKVLAEYYRNVHTFKGLFQQMDFIHLPAALHALETRLSALGRNGNHVEPDAVRALHARSGLEQARRLDLSIIEDALGAEFLRERGRIAISREQAAGLERIARRLLAENRSCLDAEAAALLADLCTIRHVNFKSLLSGYPKATCRLGERLGKEIRPFAVGGDDVWVDPDRVGSFAKTLIHVFRNAAVHGIEPPDERSAMDKDETGTVSCSVARRGEAGVVLSVSDDGRGINVEMLRSRAVSSGLLSPEEVRVLNDEAVLNLVFEGSFSTSEIVTDLSGRGVGLSAVKAALDELGGKVEMETGIGKGTVFRFYLEL